jgi:hypothetical protein
MSFNIPRKVAAIILFFAIAASSCNNAGTGKAKPGDSSTIKNEVTAPLDTSPHTQGKIAAPQDSGKDTIKKIPKVNLQHFRPPIIKRNLESTEIRRGIELDTTARKSDSPKPR